MMWMRDERRTSETTEEIIVVISEDGEDDEGDRERSKSMDIRDTVELTTGTSESLIQLRSILQCVSKIRSFYG